MMNNDVDENDNDCVFLEANNNLVKDGVVHTVEPPSPLQPQPAGRSEDNWDGRPVSPPVGLDHKALEVFRGSLTDLPKMSTNTIRIFLSSTFSGKSVNNMFCPH